MGPVFTDAEFRRKLSLAELREGTLCDKQHTARNNLTQKLGVALVKNIALPNKLLVVMINLRFTTELLLSRAKFLSNQSKFGYGLFSVLNRSEY